MSQFLQCSNGHRWQPVSDGPTVSFPTHCPTCGTPAIDHGATVTLPPSDAATDAPTGLPFILGYELLDELGRGGMGVVYKARQKSLNRLVALKVILSGGHAGAADLVRFRAEAEAVARLQHPNIVQVHESGESEGRPFFSMEFVAGGSLDDQLKGTPLPPRQAAELVETLAHAIHAAHQVGIIHRDLKPANILLRAEDCGLQIHKQADKSGTSNLHSLIPKITDFGLAKQLDSAHGQTQSGAIVGTPSYMAPEQAGGRSKDIGPATDVYSLGAVLYELLTGRPPFKAPTPLDTVLQVISEEPAPPSQLQAKTPRDLETISLKCLQKDPRKRYTTARDLAEDLRHYLNGEPIQARPVGPVERLARWARRNPYLAASASVAAAALLAVAVVSSLFAEHYFRAADDLRLALDNVRTERDNATAAHEQAQDTLARSYHEQARTALLSRQPGRRWQALELLQKSQKLVARNRDVTAIAATDASMLLPTIGELRREATSALLLDDARVVRQIPLKGAILRRHVNQNGRYILDAWWQVEATKFTLLDLNDGKTVAEFEHANSTGVFALSPDTKLMALATGNFGVQLLDPSSGKEMLTLPRLKELDELAATGPWLPVPLHVDARPVFPVRLEFSPDGNYLLVAINARANQTELILWNLRDPAASRFFAHLDDDAFCVCFRGDSRALAYTVGEKMIAVADLESKQMPKVLALPYSIGSRETLIAWSPTEPLLAIPCLNPSAGTMVVVWDFAQNVSKVPKLRWDVAAEQVAFSPDGKQLAAAGGNGIYCWHMGQERETVRVDAAHGDNIQALWWDSDGHLLTGSISNGVKVWELSDLALRSTTSVGPSEVVEALSFSADKKWLAVFHTNGLGEHKQQITLIGRDSPSAARPLVLSRQITDWPTTLSFSPNSEELALLRGRDVQIMDVRAGKESARYSPKDSGAPAILFLSVVFLHDGRLLAIPDSVQTGGELRVLDSKSGLNEVKVIAKAPRQGAHLWTASLSGDGKILAGVPRPNPSREPIRIWDVSSGKQIGELHAPEEEGNRLVSKAQPSPDLKWLVEVSLDHIPGASPWASAPFVSLWDLTSGRRLWRNTVQKAPRDIVFSPDSRTLAVLSGETDGFLELWDRESSEELFRWKSRGRVDHVAFSHDGAYLACSCSNCIDVLHLGGMRNRLARIGLDW